ncbi:MAG: C4-type zinc ribbon domain-containing protein [Candidatus Bipolaricaulota bacterium]
MSTRLADLVELGRVDAQLRATDGKLSDLAKELELLQRRRREELEAFQRRKDEHEALRRQAAQRTAEVDELDGRVRSYQHKLDNDIISYKEMEHLREQIRLLREKMDTLAEESLSLMEQAEADESRLQDDEQEHRRRLARLDEEIAGVENRVASLEAERAQQVQEREACVGKLPQHLYEQYSQLLEQVPDPLARVESENCGGCHLKLAESTLERVRAEREVVRCENCSRFLYWSGR